jgi:hypothetical protein
MRLKTTLVAAHLVRYTVSLIVAGTLGALATLPVSRTAVADDAQLLANCPVVGDTTLPKVQALNTLKRRMTVPTPGNIDSNVTLRAMVAPGDDTTRWDERHGATIEGYVADVKIGGVESVNCHTHDPAYRDTHIALTLDPTKNDESTYVIVEVTPQVREEMSKKGVDWSTKTLRTSLLGRWVRVTGWLLFDVEHQPNAKNTASGNAHIWRGTVWEIHPITAIEVLPGKPQ